MSVRREIFEKPSIIIEEIKRNKEEKTESKEFANQKMGIIPDPAGKMWE